MANKWNKSTINCYKRHVLSGLYDSDPCKTAINNERCEFSKRKPCCIKETMKDTFNAYGPPANINIDINDLVVTGEIFSPRQKELIKIFEAANQKLSREEIEAIGNINKKSVPALVSQINEKKSNYIEKHKQNGRVVYSLRQ